MKSLERKRSTDWIGVVFVIVAILVVLGAFTCSGCAVSKIKYRDLETGGGNLDQWDVSFFGGKLKGQVHNAEIEAATGGRWKIKLDKRTESSEGDPDPAKKAAGDLLGLALQAYMASNGIPSQ